MIFKGKLEELSKSTIFFSGRKNKIEVVKYDYIDIGNSHERDCVTSSYLSNFLSKNIGKEIVVAYIKANMTNSLRRETVTIGNAPKHSLIIGIKDSNGKIIVDKDVIELKGNQSNPVTGCFRNLVFIFPVFGVFTFLFSINLYTFIFMAITVGGFLLFMKNVKNKREGLEEEIKAELKRA